MSGGRGAPAASHGPGDTGLRYVGPFLKRYRGRLAGIFALTAVGSVLSLTYPFFLQTAIDRIFIGGGEAGPRMSLLRWLAAAVFGVSVVQLVLSALGSYLHTWVAAHVLFDMRSALYRHLLALPVGFFTKTRIGEVQARLGGDLAEVQAAATGALLQLVGSVLSLAGALGFLLWYSPRLTWIALAFAPPAVGLLLLFQRRIHALAYRIREHNTDITADVIETFGTVKTVKAFTAEEHRVRGFRALNLDMIGTILRFQVTNAFAAGVPGTVLIASSAVVFLVGGSMVVHGSLTVGALIACNIYLMRVFTPIQGMIGLVIRLQRARAALDRVFEFLHAGPAEETGGGRSFDGLSKGLALRGVTFGYEGDATLFDGADVEVAAGTKVAVVGRSGAGKSTLLDLVAGFVAPSRGTVELDGAPLPEFGMRSYRSRIGFVVQGGDLFSGTVAENVRFGRDGASDDEVRRAIDVAGFAPVMERLGGLGGHVEERGSGMSAGEKARLAIARAVLGDPAILLLDEALGPLDPAGGEGVLDALWRAAEGRTALFVTHDRDVAARADTVLFVTGDGGVVAGRHEELVRGREDYRVLFREGGTAGAGSDASADAGPGVGHGEAAIAVDAVPVRIAVVDSGVTRGHAHVRAVGAGLTVRWDALRHEADVVRDGAPDAIGHGTACCGVIHLMAPDAEIVPVRIFEERLQTGPEVLAAAIREAIALRPGVVHLSL
ncbi:ATP-binding cassette domain-containing protein, partial [bacterium]|nr:ATP-binding cassette domain-containing protein [bacterium]